jgi:haloacetate dehalogenase
MNTTTKIEGFNYTRIKTSGAEINLAASNPNVRANTKPALLLLHGYPQTHYMWHAIAPALAQEFHVICPDLRGYGDSSKPDSDETHHAYSKREMAQDMIELMQQLGHEQFYVVGHDRGARVAHRMTLDHPQRVLKVAVLDIVPTLEMFNNIDQISATGYYHWFFLIQDNGLPEKMIGHDPDAYLLDKLNRWSTRQDCFSSEAIDEYLRCFRMPETIHASCEDYRAAASVDLQHDRQDSAQKIGCPLLALWGKHGIIGRHYDLLSIWQNRATKVRCKSLDCGHFLAEEAADETLEQLLNFFIA